MSIGKKTIKKSIGKFYSLILFIPTKNRIVDGNYIRTCFSMFLQKSSLLKAINAADNTEENSSGQQKRI